MNFKRILFRSRKYYSEGVSLISLPLTFLGFSRSLYGLIDNLPVFRIIFPDFNTFIVCGGLGLLPFSMIIGYFWLKSPFYKGGVEVGIERNPYNWKLAPGRDSVLYFGQLIGQRNMFRLFKKQDTFEPGEEEEYTRYLEMMKTLHNGGSIQ